MLTKLSAIVVVAVMIAAMGCGSPAAPPEETRRTYTRISAAQLVDIKQDDDVILVNVHVPYEGEIPETDLLVPFDDIDALAAALPDQDARIVLYCRSGSMSTSAAKQLLDLGYTNLMELDGGMRAWTSAGGELAFR